MCEQFGYVKLLFSRESGSNGDVRVMNLDGSSQTQITLSRSTEDEPARAPAT